MHMFRQPEIKPVAAAVGAVLAVLFSQLAVAQGVATERELSPVVVADDGSYAPLDPTLPSSSHSVTRKELQNQSFVNTEDALAYAPNTTVRKRFIGDRNANLSGRSFGTLQPARGLAYVDGYLISNFLGRFDAPRWNIVAPEEVARTDVLYGPFSAIYPGNSIGTTVAITTRTPDAPEASARVLAYRQTHDDYGLKRDYGGDQESVFAGRRWGDLSMSVSLNRLAYESQPMAYASASATSANVAGLPVVSGAVLDRDPSGKARAVLGATGMQEGVQTQAKIKLAYDIGKELQADMLFAHWRNDYRVSNETLLRDADGNPYWRPASGSSAVNIDGQRYTVPAMPPQRGEDEHVQFGGRLRTTRDVGWNHSIQVSRYQMDTDSLRQANVSDPFAKGAVAGSDTRRDGTGWTTLELQSTWTPAQHLGHALTFGYHRNLYELENRVYALANWHSSANRGAETQSYLGKTEVQALYAQDAWRFHPDWVATLGLRLERFRAFDGAQFAAGSRVEHDDRSASAASPKLSLSYALNDTWLLRASYGRGVRFPTVSELFQGTVSNNSIYNNDPDLKPEKSDAMELSAMRDTGAGNLRISLYQDNVRNAIYQQRQDVGGVAVNTVQNVARVRTRGIEIAWQAADVLIEGFDLQASAAYNDAVTVSNPALPATEGKRFPRIPRVRASLHGSYERGPWTASLGIRHSGRQYGELDNSDRNADTFGAVSSFTVADARFIYRFGRQASLALGVDNLTDERYYVYHPYPGRTLYAEFSLAY